jgi:transcriptional regulator with XRE-family HTH domain
MNTLRLHRMARGLTQEKLGLRSHLTQDQISKLENGTLTPWRHQANAIAIVLGVKAETLFPDGFKTEMNYNNGSASHNLEPAYDPPAEPVFVRRYPRRDFGVMCWKCKARVTMVADSRPSAHDGDLSCYVCGAPFLDIVPLEEAARP